MVTLTYPAPKIPLDLKCKKFTYINEEIKSLNNDYPDVVEDIQQINIFYKDLKNAKACLEQEKGYRVKRFLSYSAIMLGAGGGIKLGAQALNLSTLAGFFMVFGVLNVVSFPVLTNFMKHEKNKKHDVVKAQENLNNAISALALKIKNNLIYDDKVDFFHIMHLINNINESVFDPIKDVINDFNNNVSKLENTNKCLVYVKIYNNTVKNILRCPNVEKIDNDDKYIDQSIIDYFKENEFNKIYNFSKNRIYRDILTIDKNWSQNELYCIAKFFDSIKNSQEQIKFIEYIKKNSVHAKSMIAYYAQYQRVMGNEEAGKEKSYAIDKLEDNNMDIQKFLNSCIDFNKKEGNLATFESTAKNILNRYEVINKNFYEKMDTDEKNIFNSIISTDLPLLNEQWNNLQLLNANKNQKMVVINCLTDVDKKLNSIVEQLVEKTVKDTKQIQKMYKASY